MKREDIDTYEKLFAQLESTYEELSILSKKNPNDAVNKFKLKFINNLVADSNDLIGDEYKPFKDFDHFEEDSIPQNSDVVFILSQYLKCYEKFRTDHATRKYGNWQWQLDEDQYEDYEEDSDSEEDTHFEQ